MPKLGGAAGARAKRLAEKKEKERLLLEQRKEREELAQKVVVATALQRMLRGRRARKRTAELLIVHRAAVRIQRIFRGKKAREEFDARRQRNENRVKLVFLDDDGVLVSRKHEEDMLDHTFELEQDKVDRLRWIVEVSVGGGREGGRERVRESRCRSGRAARGKERGGGWE